MSDNTPEAGIPAAYPNYTAEQITALPHALSAARFGTFLRMANGDPQTALATYEWHLRLVSAVTLPIHMVEVSVRNAIGEAFSAAYGRDDWHESATLVSDLRDPMKGYSPRRELASAKQEVRSAIQKRQDAQHERDKRHAVRLRRPPPAAPAAVTDATPVPIGSVIAELKLRFWTSCLTKSFDMRVWEDHINTAFPNLEVPPSTTGMSNARDGVHSALDRVRRFRNRAYHHEPLLRANVESLLGDMLQLVGWRCEITAEWVRAREQVTDVHASRPTIEAVRPQR